MPADHQPPSSSPPGSSPPSVAIAFLRLSTAHTTLLNALPLSSVLAGWLILLGQADRGLSVLFSDDAELQRLNRQHRRIDSPTDVLAFSYHTLPPPQSHPAPQDWPLGDLVLSVPRAQAQALAAAHPLEKEICRLLAHGCVHLLGYDHQHEAQWRGMQAIEDVLLQNIPQRDAQLVLRTRVDDHPHHTAPQRGRCRLRPKPQTGGQGV